MIRIMQHGPGTVGTTTTSERIGKDIAPPEQGFVWVDFDGADLDHEREVLERQFGISSLAVDDAQRQRHPPKIEWFNGYCFVLLKGFTEDTNSIDYNIVHISFLVGPNFLLTRHAITSPSINRVWQEVEQNPSLADRGTGYLLYRIVRTIIDRYAPIILGLETRLETLEDTMLEAPSDDALAELVSYNSQLKKLRRIYNAQSICLEDLEKRRRGALIGELDHEFQDLREQMQRLASLTGLLQELARDLIDGYISISSHRLNNIMKILTIASVIFLPLTFLAGIYGMNFEHMPELHTRGGYFVLLSLMGVIAVGLLYAFRRVRWL